MKRACRPQLCLHDCLSYKTMEVVMSCDVMMSTSYNRKIRFWYVQGESFVKHPFGHIYPSSVSIPEASCNYLFIIYILYFYIVRILHLLSLG